MSTFTQRLGLLMYENDYNKTELARKLEVNPSTVYRWWERGNIPEYKTLIDLAQMFNVSEKWLLGEIEEREPYHNPRYMPDEVITEQKENELDEELVRTLRSLNPAQLQRVRDFLAGLKG